jgi:hypothetical protein
MKLHEKIKWAREDCGMTLIVLAFATDIEIDSLKDFEAGRLHFT